MRAWSGLLVSCFACGPASPPIHVTYVEPPSAAPPPAPTVAPPPAPTVAPPSPTTIASAPGCEVGVRTTVTPLDDGRFELIATASNLTDRPLEATIRGACPGPLAQFDGLPAGHDYGSTCRAGICPGGPSASRPLTLPPHGAVEVARVTVDPEGDACSPALPAGRYSVGATVTLDGADACSTSRGELVVDTQPPPHPPHRPATSPPVPAPQTEPCPPVACIYEPCPPGVTPPTGCLAACGCAGMR